MVGLMARDMNLGGVHMTNVKRTTKTLFLRGKSLVKKMTHKDAMKNMVLQIIMFLTIVNLAFVACLH